MPATLQTSVIAGDHALIGILAAQIHSGFELTQSALGGQLLTGVE